MSMEGKICLVTGATAGIGEVAAKELARQKATVIVVGRNPQKTQNVVNKIQQETQNKNVSYLLADLSSMQEVRKLAAEFLSKFDRLDVLLNNAGAVFPTRKQTADGLEMTFGLNHISYFLLTNLLLDVLKKSAPSRIINVSSAAHIGAKLNFDDLQAEKSYSAMNVYSRSKLANLLFTFELDRKLQGSGVTVNAVHPGLVASDFGNESMLFKKLKQWFTFVYLTSEQGAQTLIYLASSPEVEGVSGKYFSKKKVRWSSGNARNSEFAAKLWSVSEKLCNLGHA